MPTEGQDTLIASTSLETQPEKLKAGKIPVDVGHTGLNVLYGAIYDHYTPNRETTTGYSRIETYKKMQSDPTISGALQGYENILSLVSWDVKEVDREKAGIAEEDFDPELAKTTRDYVQSCFDDMTGTSINDLISSALDMLSMGHQITVPLFKLRKGYQDDMRLSSKYSDGRIGWKSWRTIRQEMVEKWLTPDGGGYSDLTGVQQKKINGGYINIPRNRFLLFRTTSKGDNIEGESILYGAVGTWKRLIKTLNIEGVSLSRNLEGIPVLKISNVYLSERATPEQKTFRDLMIKQTLSVKYNDQTAIILPSDLDPDTKAPLVSIELLTAGPNVRVDQCRSVAEACEKLIAESILANFIKLGNGGGSYAMSSSLQDMFVLAMKKYLDNISNVINDEAIPNLLRVNGMDTKYAPRLVHQGLDTESSGVFVDALGKAIASGAIVPTKSMQRNVLQRLRLPTEEADKAWDELEKIQEQMLQQTLVEGNLDKTPSGETRENKSNKDELEKVGVELQPEKVSKSMTEVYFYNDKPYVLENDALVELKLY